MPPFSNRCSSLKKNEILFFDNHELMQSHLKSQWDKDYLPVNSLNYGSRELLSTMTTSLSQRTLEQNLFLLLLELGLISDSAVTTW